MDGDLTYRDYKKFGTSSRIVGMGEAQEIAAGTDDFVVGAFFDGALVGDWFGREIGTAPSRSLTTAFYETFTI
jgi:hypothetical protein